ncbi:MAG TPA: RNA 2',3'-cyclic phosphodiesterase [Thermomicrobiaceae bacterium]|nr:RNA 2',3'-cyclic phosphodiesterase [Thermomicrobiaceae bacterium]
MNAAWRLFLAVDIPAEARARIAEVATALKVAGWRARWANPEGTHLTLKFYGEVPVDQIGALRARLSVRLPLQSSFQLRVQGAGVFPNRGPARVLWLGLAGELNALGALQREVEGLSRELGYPVERRPFAPHLTVARIRPEDASTLTGLDAQLKRIGNLAPIPFAVSKVTLFRSELLPSGAVYTPIAEFALGSERQ